MIINFARNTSVLAMGMMIATITSTDINSSINQIPDISYSTYVEQSTLPNIWLKNGFETMNQNVIKTYSENKKGDFMLDTVRSKKLISTKVANYLRTNSPINDLGYYEENEIESLEIKSRKEVRVKAKIVSAKRVTNQLS